MQKLSRTLLGVTGKHTQLDGNLEAFMARCRQATSLPLALGFGLRPALTCGVCTAWQI